MNRLTLWKRAILAHRTPGMHGEVRALLLYAVHHPTTKASAVWSIPRQQLAETFNVHPSYITKWIQRAKAEGLIDTVRSGRPGVTAVYQGLVPPATPVNWSREKAAQLGAFNVTKLEPLLGALDGSTTVEAAPQRLPT